MQNVRRRSEDEVSKARKYALESFADSLLPVCDSLEAGLAHQNATSEQIREGAEATLRQLKAALERNKVMEINPAAGAKFDPHQHQAISVVPSRKRTPWSRDAKGYVTPTASAPGAGDGHRRMTGQPVLESVTVIHIPHRLINNRQAYRTGRNGKTHRIARHDELVRCHQEGNNVRSSRNRKALRRRLRSWRTRRREIRVGASAKRHAVTNPRNTLLR